jgi:hypothetical protein
VAGAFSGGGGGGAVRCCANAEIAIRVRQRVRDVFIMSLVLL